MRQNDDLLRINPDEGDGKSIPSVSSMMEAFMQKFPALKSNGQDTLLRLEMHWKEIAGPLSERVHIKLVLPERIEVAAENSLLAQEFQLQLADIQEKAKRLGFPGRFVVRVSRKR
jgi:hypothetical protein